MKILIGVCCSIIAIIATFCICIFCYSKPIEEAKLLGSWQADVPMTKSVFTFHINHTFSLTGNGSNLVGKWSLDGNYLVIDKQSWTSGNTAVNISGRTQRTKIAELTDSMLVLRNFGGDATSMKRVDFTP